MINAKREQGFESCADLMPAECHSFGRRHRNGTGILVQILRLSGVQVDCPFTEPVILQFRTIDHYRTSNAIEALVFHFDSRVASHRLPPIHVLPVWRHFRDLGLQFLPELQVPLFVSVTVDAIPQLPSEAEDPFCHVDVRVASPACRFEGVLYSHGNVIKPTTGERI